MNEKVQFIFSAFGNAVFSSIWQAGFLWLLVAIYAKFHRNLSAEKLSTISFVALIASFIAFVATFVFSFIVSNSANGFILGNRFHLSVPYTTVMAYSAWIYILFLIIPVGKLIAGIRGVYRMQHKGLGKVPGHIKIFLLDATQLLGIKRQVHLFTSTLASTPLTIGFLKPVILLPIAVINQLTTSQVEAILLHELAHIKRNDYLKNIITQIIQTTLYFNPFIKMLSNLQCTEREKSADKWVMQFEYNPLMYANTLLQLAKQNMYKENKLTVLASAKNQPLLERIEYMTGKKQRKHPSVKAVFGLTAMASLAFAMWIFQNRYPDQLSETAHSRVPTLASSITQNTPYGGLHNTEPLPISATVPKKAIRLAVATAATLPKNVRKKSLLRAVSASDKNDVVSPKETEETIATLTFVSHTSAGISSLTETEEKNVQEVLEIAKKIIIEQNWQIIENALAESMNAGDKQLLKEAYIAKMQHENWSQEADLLRMHYDDIDWKMTREYLIKSAVNLRLGGIHQQYKQVIASMKEYLIQLRLLDMPQQKLQGIEQMINRYEASLHKLDSLQIRKIVDI